MCGQGTDFDRRRQPFRVALSRSYLIDPVYPSPIIALVPAFLWNEVEWNCFNFIHQSIPHPPFVIQEQTAVSSNVGVAREGLIKACAAVTSAPLIFIHVANDRRNTLQFTHPHTELAAAGFKLPDQIIIVLHWSRKLNYRRLKHQIIRNLQLQDWNQRTPVPTFTFAVTYPVAQSYQSTPDLPPVALLAALLGSTPVPTATAALP